VFSLGPLMVIAIAIAGFAFGDEAARGEVSGQLKNLLGDAGAQAVEAMLSGADRHHNGLFAATIGVGTLLFAAIWIVVAGTLWWYLLSLAAEFAINKLKRSRLPA